MPDHDYEDLSEKTIDEIKETVKDEDLDLRKLLKAEKNNKDRKTLKEWLNTKIDDQDDREKDERKAETAEEKHTEARADEKAHEKSGSSMWKRPKTVFLLGLVIGLALGASALYTSNMSGPGGQAAISPQQATSQTNAYFTDQLGGSDTNISVGAVDGSTYSDLYVLTMGIQTGNQSLTRDVYMSKQSGLLFVNTLVGGSPPIDIENGQPVGTQGQTQGSQ